MLRLAFTNFLQLCHRNVSFLLLSFACLVCAFVSFLFLQERGYYMYTESVELNQKTRLLYVASENAETIKSLYTEISDSSALPKVKSATVSDGQYAGVYWDVRPNEETWYTPYGRFFSADEIKSGAKVALLATGFISRLAPESINTVWESGIEIAGTHFNAIGNYFNNWETGAVPEDAYQTEPLPVSVAMPFKTYFDLGLAPTRFRCVFSQPLTNAQIALIRDLVRPMSSIDTLLLPQEHDTEAVNAYIGAIVPYTLVMVLSLLSIASIILYWLSREFERYKIYLICGAKGRQIAFMLSLNTALLVTAGYGSACFAMSQITVRLPEKLLSPLPWQFHIVLYFAALLFMLFTVNIKAIPIVFQKKML